MSAPVFLKVKAHDLIRLARTANKALRGDSNDAEHDALHEIREEILDIVKESPVIDRDRR
jgi:hypothetical protein